MIIRSFPGKRAVFHKQAGEVILDKVKNNTPFDSGRTEGTHLRDAIYSKVGSKGGYTVVRPDYKKAHHAHLVEEGHVYRLKDGTEKKSKAAHMFKIGGEEAKTELMYMANNFVNEIVGELK
jgi:hypothetical protein